MSFGEGDLHETVLDLNVKLAELDAEAKGLSTLLGIERERADKLEEKLERERLNVEAAHALVREKEALARKVASLERDEALVGLRGLASDLLERFCERICDDACSRCADTRYCAYYGRAVELGVELPR